MSESTRNQAQDVHDLEPTAIIEFFAIYYDPVANPDAVFRFHSGKNGGSVDSQIYWKGNAYIPMPMEGEGWEVANANQKMPRPKLKFANSQFIISQIIQTYNRLLNAKVVRQKVYTKYIDSENFENGINPHGIPNRNAGMPEETFYISRVINENRNFVQFELVSALELENIKIPNRQIIARFCPFAYRGAGCGYSGPPTETSKGTPFYDYQDNVIGADALVNKNSWNSSQQSYSIGDYVWKPSKTIRSRDIKNPNIVEYVKIYYVCRQNHISTENTDPFKRPDLWVKDDCSRKISGCKARFTSELPFGGFLGVYGYGS